MKRYITIIICIYLFLINFINYSRVSAREKIEGITVWPTFQDIKVKRSETFNTTINIENSNKYDIAVNIYFRNIKISDTPQQNIELSEEKDKLPASWLSCDNECSISIKQGEKREINVMLNIPGDAEIIGYYPAIILDFHIKGEENTITSQSQIASVLYLSVMDEKEEEAQRKIYLKGFGINKKLLFKPELEFTAKIQNVGDLHARPRGTIEIYDPRGTRQKEVLTINDKLIYLLPSQVLEENFEWKDTTLNSFFPPIGNYKAVLNVIIEEDRSQIISSELEFFVFPIIYLFYGCISLSSIILLIVFINKVKRGIR